MAGSSSYGKYDRRHDRVTSSPGAGNKQNFAYNASTDKTAVINWGQVASRSLYSSAANLMDDEMKTRSLLSSRLWHGVPQLTLEQMAMFEAAYTGHTFIFVVDVPKFMYTGIYADTNLHHHAKNLKAVIERSSTAFNGTSNMTAEFGTQNDGNGKKLDFVTAVYKDQSDITLRLREFAGLPVKNALESWVTGTFDPKSQHGNYFGNLGIPGGWCLANHTMSILVVQVDPSWQVIQDAAFYYNMFPVDVPFDHFEWTKGEQGIVDDLSIQFKCNEERSPMVMYAAERFMNNRVLSMVSTSVYNSRQFVVSDFMVPDTTTNNTPTYIPQDYDEFKKNLGDGTATDINGVSYEYNPHAQSIIDARQYNIKITDPSGKGSMDPAIAEGWSAINGDQIGKIKTDPNSFSTTTILGVDSNTYNNDFKSGSGTQTINPWARTATTSNNGSGS